MIFVHEANVCCCEFDFRKLRKLTFKEKVLMKHKIGEILHIGSCWDDPPFPSSQIENNQR